MRLRTPLHIRLLRQTLIYLILPTTFLLAFRLFWGFQAAHRLANSWNALHAAGTPLSADDFPDGDALPREQNGFYDFIDAYNLYAPTPAESEAISLSNHDTPFNETLPTPAEGAVIQGYLVSAQPIFDLLKGAASRPEMVIPRSQLRPFFETRSLLSSARVRNMTYFLQQECRAALNRRDEAEALRCLRTVFTLARATDQFPFPICHLQASSIRAMACVAIEYWTPSFQLRDPSAIAEARILLLQLMDDTNAREALSRSIAPMAQIMPRYIDSDFPWLSAWWIRPLRDDSLARYNAGVLDCLPAVRAPNWRLASSLPNDPQVNSNLEDIMRLATYSWSPSSARRIVLFHMRALSDTHATALLLAARLYAAAHGTPPETAAQLVPEFLAQVPLDPFSNGDLLRYRLDPDGVTVWSVGENATNEGAVVQYETNGNRFQRYGIGPSCQNDIVYGAAWRRPGPPPVVPPR